MRVGTPALGRIGTIVNFTLASPLDYTRGSTSQAAAGVLPATSKPGGDATKDVVAAATGGSAALATAATVSAVGQQVLQNVGSNLGRGRFLVATGLRAKDAIRETVAAEHARWGATNVGTPGRLRHLQLDAAGTLRGLTQLQWKKIGRDAVIGATSDTVPTSGGVIKIAGKVLTTDGWRGSLRLGSYIGIGLTGATLLGAGLNFSSGIEQDGAAGLIGTYQGRTGALMSLGAALGIGVATFAATFKRNPGQSFKDAYLAADWLQKPKVKMATYAAGFGIGPLLTLNLAGGLNWLNSKPAAPATPAGE